MHKQLRIAFVALLGTALAGLLAAPATASQKAVPMSGGVYSELDPQVDLELLLSQDGSSLSYTTTVDLHAGDCVMDAGARLHIDPPDPFNFDKIHVTFDAVASTNDAHTNNGDIWHTWFRLRESGQSVLRIPYWDPPFEPAVYINSLKMKRVGAKTDIHWTGDLVMYNPSRYPFINRVEWLGYC